MEEQQKPLEYEQNPRMRWAGVIIGVGFLFAALQTIGEHGLRNWDWVLNAALAGMGFSWLLNDWQDPKRDLRWLARVLGVVWGSLFIAYIAHSEGLVVGLCLAGVFVLPVITAKSGFWSLTSQSPLGIAYWLLIIFLLEWFARRSNAWIPFSCAAAVAILLAYQPAGRRSMRQNLLRPASVSWLALEAIAFLWFWKQPSFAGGLLYVAIPVLWFGNLLLHLSSGGTPCSISPAKLNSPRRITTTIRSFLRRRTGGCSASAITPTDTGTTTCSKLR